MKTLSNIIYILSSILALSSCVSEEPFAVDGEGALRMKMMVSGEITRAEGDADAELANKCKILISKAEKGLIHKYEGVNSVPDRLILSTGRYVAEGYAGDSVSASWDKKFYKGRQEFQIQSGYDTEVNLVCRIANVVVAIDSQDMDPNKIQDWTLTVGHSRGELEFTEANVDAKGYFMMPSADWNSADGTNLGSLHYTITGKDGNGKEFEPVSGTVNDVQAAHQYTFNVHFGIADVSSLGGGYITVEVSEEERVIEDNVMLFGPPVIVSATEGVDIKDPVVFAPREYPSESLVLGVKTHLGMSRLTAEFSEDFGMDYSSYDLLQMTGVVSDALSAAGFSMSPAQESGSNENRYVTRYLTMTKAMLNKLHEGNHWLKLTVTDEAGKTTEKVIEFTVSDASVVVEKEPLKVRSHSAQLALTVLDETVTNPGVRYRVKNQGDWTEVRAQNGVVSLTGLAPATTYEVQAIADGYVNEISVEFTTEDIFTIPNASFEDWTMDGKIAIPASTTTSTFWDTGNQAAASFIGSNTIQDNTVKHTGNSSAKLKSEWAIVKLAAGNLFAGKFKGIDGTDGILEFGQPFNHSHPVKLVGYAYYNPGSVNRGDGEKIKKGSTDEGQIYIALTTSPFEIRTKKNNRQLFNPNDPNVIAYGDVVWSETYGSDSEMRRFEIPIEYYPGKENLLPEYIILVASSSRYGDYYEGSDSSVMYLDDLELIYE